MLPDEDLTQSPAGEGADTSTPEPLSASAAAAMLTQMEAEENTPAPTNTEPEQPQEAQDEATAAADDEAATTEGETEGEPEQTGEENTETDDQPLDFERLHGNTKLRLRDGTEVSVGDLKKRWGDLTTLEQQKQDFEAFAQSKVGEIQKAEQHTQLLTQILPQAIAALTAQVPEVPPMPPASLLHTDFMAYHAQKAAHDEAVVTRNAKLGELQQLQAFEQQKQMEAQQAADYERQEYVQRESEALLSKAKDLRDPAKRQAFLTDFHDVGTKAYGFTPDELNSTGDHRLLLMARDAIAYRKLQANPPKPVTNKPSATQGAPIAAPGRRQSAPEAQAERRQDLMQRVHKPGGLSAREAASILSELERN